MDRECQLFPQSPFLDLIRDVLNSIPSHNESPKPLEDICSTVSSKSEQSKDIVFGVTAATLAFLDTFGVLSCENNNFRFIGQIPHYFRHSLCWYIKNNQKLFSNWNRSGTSREIKITNLLNSAPYFLKMIEEQRLRISENNGLNPESSRSQPAAILLIKASCKNSIYFLHQWDRQAQQYQIIGGRQRLNEINFDTAKRELEEELTEHELVYKRDYELELLNESPIKWLEVSPTYGALTQYEFYLYSVKLYLRDLKLSTIDRWISLDEMKKGITLAGKKIRNPELHALFNQKIPGGIQEVPNSVERSQIKKFWDYVEIKPKFFGIASVDIKALLQNVFSKKQV